MAVTRIKNNQITDLTVNAAAKLQDYTITSGKIANNLTYNSDLTISGNLIVNGNTTTIDTVNLVVEDPLILLAKEQTGSPTLDIGFIGKRGTSDNIAFVWDEGDDAFVTAFTDSETTNTTINVTSYASFKTLNANITGNIDVGGNISITGNLVGDITVDGNVDANNFLTAGIVSATGNVTGGNLLTAGIVSAGGTVTGSSVLTGGIVSATGTITGGNLATGGTISGTGNITGGNVLTSGLISATGNGTFGNISTAGTFGAASLSASGNVTGGNLLTAGIVSAGGTVTGSSVLTGGIVSATGTITGGNLDTGGTVSSTGNITGGNVLTAGIVSATGNGSFGNISTTLVSATTVSATGNVNVGNLNASSGQVSAATGYFTGNVDVLGNLNATVGVVYANSGIFLGDAVTGNGAAFAGIPGFTPLGSNVVMQFAGNVNSYSQLNFQNINAGNRASTDYIATADNGDDNNYYINLGINSSTFNDPVNYPGFAPNDSYVHNHGGNLILNPETTGKTIKLMVGGTDSTDVIAEVSETGLTVTGTASVTGTVTGGNLATGGTISGTGNVTGGNVLTGGLVSATGNVTGGNVLTGGQVSATGNVSAGNVNTNNIVGTTVTITASSDIVFGATGNIDAGNVNILNVADPVNDGDAANKGYVDSVAQGLDVKASCLAATTGDLDAATGGTVSYNNGASGVGATLTTTGAFTTIDTANVQTVGTRILVKNEANTAWNGIYSYSNATVITRTTDFDNGSPSGEIPGAFTFIEAGSVNADSGWVCTTNAPVSVGNTAITFTQFSGAGTYTAGNGISFTGTVINALTDGVTTAINGSNQIEVKASANLVTPNIGAATGTSLSTTGTITGGNLATGGTASATGNITGGNVLTGGLVSAGGTITGSSLLTGGTVSATGNVTGGNILTGGLISAGGTVTGSSLATGGTVSAAGTVTGSSILTGGTVSAAGTVTGSSLLTGGVISATGNVTGGNINTAGDVSATGNVNSGNVNTTLVAATTVSATGNVNSGNVNAGLISATGNVVSGNVNTVTVSATGNVVAVGFTGGNASVTGNVYATNFIGNISGNIDAAGANTQIQFNDSDLLGASANLTFDKATNSFTVSNGNITGGNLLTGGLISATANITGGNLLTGGLISATGNINSGANIVATANVIGGNITTGGLVSAGGTVTGSSLLTGGTVSATGTITGGNLVTAGNGNIGNIRIAGDDITGTNGVVTFNDAGSDVNFRFEGDTDPNLLVLDAGTDTVNIGTATPVTGAKLNIGATNSMIVPTGNTAQRPGTGQIGMFRFNTNDDALEVYATTGWEAVGVPAFTVIADDQFTGDGSTVQFTLGQDSTTAATIVSINGVVQIPTTAYSVSGNVLTFTEAPLSTDTIDARTLTTTTSVVSISNSSGNAVIGTSETADTITVTGNIIPTANIVYDLGNTTNRFNDLYLAGNTITLGNCLLKNTTGNSIGFFGPDGTTPATIDAASVDTTQIANGTSSMAVIASGGNIRGNVGGSTITNIYSSGLAVTGLISATGTVTGTTFVGVATSAQYADLAEMYAADQNYEPGTVLSFGGAHEVTLSSVDADSRVAGVVSTNPSYLMNSALESEHTVALALTGRVPTHVTGRVRKGDMMVSNGDGTARAEPSPRIGTVIGKALEDFDGESGVIEVVIGRL